jgi:cell division protein FtsW
MRLTRADDSVLSEWWFTVDRRLVGLMLALFGAGFVLSLAASPAIAIKKGLPAFHFVERQALFAALGAAVMVAVSMLPPRYVRRLALALLVAAVAGLVAVLVAGPEINGARRWLRLAGITLQPSEIAKPAFVVIVAWLMAEERKGGGFPALAIAIGIYATVATLLVLQPDLGQTLLVTALWSALFFLSGQSLARAGLVAALGVGLLGGAALVLGHARSRLVRFFSPSSGDTYQVDKALQSFSEGGLFGRGPGEGTVKMVLPDAHTDFVFAVLAEEFGAIACLALVGAFAVLLISASRRARSEPDLFTRLAILGLVLLIVLQAVINMGVNVGLLPAKGMTLPFLSAGGSSTLAVAIAGGMLLALMRQRAGVEHVKLPRLGRRVEAARRS